MGRVTAGRTSTVVLAGRTPVNNPDGARTTFPLREAAAAGSLAPYRKPSIAALAADVAPATVAAVGVDVAAAGPAQVALVSEVNALRAIVDQLRTDRDNMQTTIEAIRTVVNRSYLRDDPDAYYFGGDLAAGLTIAPAGANSVSSAGSATDANDGTYAVVTAAQSVGWTIDLGSPYAISRVGILDRYEPGGGTGYDQGISVYGRLASGDAWTLICSMPDGSWVMGNRASFPVTDAGPWRHIKANITGGPGDSRRIYAWEVIGGDEVTQLNYATAPTAAERLILDLAENE